eukprot:CAMPEP_0174743128 /NCGR_PEP_ID=MMETSP1094-20130205/80817_1 /TAXON_ID=156173 /ORGANISM="Chrysochromulina brevifilum, Strain UTEX LB 985" /LENGTH=46 /DNA_ID= /DNA_START= /DNA_END= /DNA_ORIENTATION=
MRPGKGTTASSSTILCWWYRGLRVTRRGAVAAEVAATERSVRSATG